MSEDEKKDSLDRELDELKEEFDEEDQEYEWLEESEPQEDTPQEENLEESEANPETIAEFLKAEEEEEIRAKKLRILNTILKQQTDTEFSSFLQEHIEIENMTKIFCFALSQIVEGTANTFTLTVTRENEMIKLQYQFFDKDGSRIYFEKDGTISKIHESGETLKETENRLKNARMYAPKVNGNNQPSENEVFRK